MTLVPSSNSGRRGMAVIVVIALIALVLFFMVGNARTLHYLSRNVKLIEEKQKRRLVPVTHPEHLQAISPTNSVPSHTNAAPPR